MAATSSVTFTAQYEDDTSDKITIGPVEASALNTATLKSQVQQFNANIGTNGFAKKLVSKSGANWRGISAVRITTTERNYFF